MTLIQLSRKNCRTRNQKNLEEKPPKVLLYHFISYEINNEKPNTILLLQISLLVK